ncbi:dynein axonemal intermediate chain 4-like [Thunnus albacares]|uniref:dynein axonemal intermediate chain 4-like n=1 Tax=Thunnus albacares TaxID=8236 RepID=UPI001CF69BED|nr:dynein axonemal intermediate chain 4-like [Thunnus albacares]XP_044223553.1 dynein axonemal intermediate chain 4-like [Thunnus albacares]
MSTAVAKEERQKRRTLLLKPSSRTINTSVSAIHGVTQSTRLSASAVASPSRRSFSLLGGSKVLEKSTVQTPRQAVRVFDEEDNDVTPQPLYQAEAGALQAKAGRFFLDEISAGSTSEQTTTSGSFSMPFSRSILGSSRISSQSTIESVNEEIEDTFSKRDIPINFPDLHRKRNSVKEQVTDNMLKAVIDVYISETDSISLLDIPSTFVSVDADNAEAIIERNNQYAKVCKNRMGNDKYTDRAMQTLNAVTKNKQVPSDSMVMVDAATTVTTWDMYDTSCSSEQDKTVCSPEPEKAEYPEAVMDTSRGAERSLSVGSTTSTGSAASSLKDMEVFGNSLNAETDLQLIMHSEKFQHSLLVMERSILGNTLQPKLAAYRQLPVLEDPDSPMKPGAERCRQEDTESSPTPALERLWTFTCELSKGRSVSSMAWNTKNPDLLAVGYGESDSQKPGLVCCWSLKNPTWPERVIHCDNTVTSLDFSANNPSQLAVGMLDGSIAIYSVQSQDKNTRVISSRGCPNKHLGPVWQLRWTQQELSLTGDEKVEALFSVAADGRISKWFVCNNGLECTDLMKLKRIHNTKKKAGGTKTEKNTESILSALTPGLCFDFHPTDSSIYLAGTWEGLIHKCSCYNSQQFLETYRKHYCPVNSLAWCPLSPDVFLSCSSDWTIQLWKQDHFSPVLSLASAQRAVCDIKWSPKWATVFGAVNEGQLEIWDLNSSILDPIIVQPATPGVTMKSLLFATQTNCVLVGDSDGQVTVYQLKNLSLGESSQVDILESIICSAISRLT